MKKIFSLACFLSILILSLTSTVNAFGYNSASFSSSYDIFPTFIFIIMLVYIIIFIVWLAAAYWAYKDAKKRGVEHPGLWGVVVFFAGLIGIIIYLVLRNNLKPSTLNRFCTSCGRIIPFDANICPYCGKKFEKYI